MPFSIFFFFFYIFTIVEFCHIDKQFLPTGTVLIFITCFKEIFASKNPSPTEDQQINHVFETTQSELTGLYILETVNNPLWIWINF